MLEQPSLISYGHSSVPCLSQSQAAVPVSRRLRPQDMHTAVPCTPTTDGSASTPQYPFCPAFWGPEPRGIMLSSLLCFMYLFFFTLNEGCNFELPLQLRLVGGLGMWWAGVFIQILQFHGDRLTRRGKKLLQLQLYNWNNHYSPTQTNPGHCSLATSLYDR